MDREADKVHKLTLRTKDKLILIHIKSTSARISILEFKLIIRLEDTMAPALPVAGVAVEI
jgi:hypothetical protein